VTDYSADLREGDAAQAASPHDLKDAAATASWRDYVALMKPRVMTLVVFTGLAGFVAAPVDVNLITMAIAMLCVAVGAGAAGAFNMAYDADIDAIMKRTRRRPVPMGRVPASEAYGFSAVMAMASVLLLALATNYVAAGLLAFSIFFYTVIYTVWLKRSTPQNIVIGGAAGAFPPMIGWVAATGTISVEAVLMFALIFMWTPPHFWALALFMKSDYDDAGVPMLTVTHGRRETRRHILIYTVLLVPVALGLAVTPVAGPLYLAAALVLNAIFLKGAWDIWRRDEAIAEADNYAVEKRVFRFSILYLFLHFGVLLVEAALTRAGWTLIGG